ncbi:hypothetical protein [Spirillospora sp. NPDC047279]|uniref:hypothetical protein n=1 Tax=Spirillospora sp. NPDC047279 TaxID=3155478 RepID=UPI0033D2028C
MNTGIDGGVIAWLGPIVIALALVAMLSMIATGLRRTNAASRLAATRPPAPAGATAVAGLATVPTQRDAPRHEVGGGFYRYRPGMYSHSYSEEEMAALDSAEKKAILPA